MKMNFCELIDKYIVTIPMIQRDYAQGRKSEERIREDILSCMVEKIDNGLHLDFIYGSVEKLDSQDLFIPLDGQQRLTTLFLLHWYASIKEGGSDDISKKLKKFRYETRTNSTDFITALVDCKYKIPACTKDNKNVISSAIEDSSWFVLFWKHDPTVNSILTMLDAIHVKFCEKHNLLDQLNNITFDVIELKKYKLTDDLYIKMNARGVPLTQFENFKAKFEKILESENLENKLFVDNKETLKSYFSRKIETDWVDSFWDYKTEKEICEMRYQTIDEPFMRFFWYVTEMLYFKDGSYPKDKNGKAIIAKFSFNNNNPIIDYDLLKNVYFNNQENVRYLFKILDNVEIIKNQVNKFLCFEYQEGKVSLFKKEINLLREVIEKGNIDSQDKLILFVIINYMQDGYNEKNLGDEHLHDLVRVTRNLLIRVRKQSGISFLSDLNDQKMHNCINVIRNLTCDENSYKTLQDKPHGHFLINKEQLYSVQSEIKKAKLITQYPELRDAIFKLEDHPEVKGAIHNFMPETEESFSREFIVNFQSRVKVFNQIWSYDCSLVVRAFISCGEDYHVWIKNSNLGGLWFFGNKENWNIILTQNRSNDKFLVNFLDRFDDGSISRVKLEDIISRYLVDKGKKGKEKVSWRYYFVKYKKMTCINKDGYKNLYSWYNGFRIRDLSGITLKGWHVNPYARVVWEMLDRKEGIFKGIFSESSYEAPLLLSNDIGLYCEEEGKGWRIEIPNLTINKNACFIDWLIANMPNIQIEAGKTWLKPTETMDMIEVAVAFICELYQLENPLDKNKVVDSYAEVIA